MLGSSLATFKQEDGKLDSMKSRLYEILVTESAHLIWVLRCERRITTQDAPQNHHTEESMQNRWYRRINERMIIDCLLTNKHIYVSKALKTKTVYNTWAKCSTNEMDLHQEWCKNPGVLVGKELRQPLG